MFTNLESHTTLANNLPTHQHIYKCVVLDWWALPPLPSQYIAWIDCRTPLCTCHCILRRIQWKTDRMKLLLALALVMCQSTLIFDCIDFQTCFLHYLEKSKNNHKICKHTTIVTNPFKAHPTAACWSHNAVSQNPEHCDAQKAREINFNLSQPLGTGLAASMGGGGAGRGAKVSGGHGLAAVSSANVK